MDGYEVQAAFPDHRPRVVCLQPVETFYDWIEHCEQMGVGLQI